MSHGEWLQKRDLHNETSCETNYSSTGEALQIVNDNLTLNKRNLEKIFAQVADKPVIIVSIAGYTRKGKSFLLTLVMHYLALKDKKQWFTSTDSISKKAFEWNNLPESLTNGIWMWSQPLTVEGIDYPILLMDSQGTFGNNMDKALSTKIFSLSALTSSVLIYNVTGGINSNDLTNLECFSKNAETCSTLNGDEKPFQKLLFLVRDWELGGYENGFIGGTKYVSNTLSSNTEESKTNKAILALYGKPSGFLMSRPGGRVTKAQVRRLNEIPTEFKNEVKTFVDGLFTVKYLEPKKVNGVMLTGNDLMVYFASLTNLFNTRSELTLKTPSEALGEVAITQAKQCYKQELLNYSLYAMQNTTADYREFTVKAMVDELERFDKNLIRNLADIDNNIFTKLLIQLSEGYEEITRELKVNFTEAVNLYKELFPRCFHSSIDKTNKDIMKVHHVSLIAALRLLVKDKDRCCDVREEDIVQFLDDIWKAFIEEYNKIKIKVEFQKVSSINALLKERKTAHSLYKTKAEEFLRNRGLRFPSEAEIENKHTECVSNIRETFTRNLNGKADNEEIQRNLAELLIELNNEKKNVKREVKNKRCESEYEINKAKKDAVTTYKNRAEACQKNKKSEILSETEINEMHTELVEDIERIFNRTLRNKADSLEIERSYSNLLKQLDTEKNRIQKEMNIKKKELKAAFQQATNDSFSSYKSKLIALRDTVKNRFPSESEVKKKHTKIVNDIKERFKKDFKEKADDEEIERNLSQLLNKLDDEKDAFISEIRVLRQQHEEMRAAMFRAHSSSMSRPANSPRMRFRAKRGNWEFGLDI